MDGQARLVGARVVAKDGPELERDGAQADMAVERDGQVADMVVEVDGLRVEALEEIPEDGVPVDPADGNGKT